MSRIPAQELERLKAEVSVERLALARGVALRAHGKDLIGLCPFHDDKEPSLVITPAKNLWHCLGACQAGGSAIDWVMKAEGVSFRHAVELLRAEVAGAGPRSASRTGKAQRFRALPPPVERDADDQKVLLQVVTYYHQVLKESPEGLQYLEKRGLRSPEVIEEFKLGYSNRSLGYRLPMKSCKQGAELRGKLEKLGVFRESGHEHLAGSLVIPIFGEQGEVLGMYGRKTRNDLRPGTPPHLYLPGPHKGVFNVQALQAAKEVILCEALLDALTFWCAGFRNVTASYGVEGFTEDHMAAFKRYGTERVLIAYDRDDAGDRAAEALAERLMAEGIECFRILFPKGMDANEYALRVGPAAKALDVVIRKAVWMGKGAAPAAREELSVVGCQLSEEPHGESVSGEQAAKEEMINDAGADAAIEPQAAPDPARRGAACCAPTDQQQAPEQPEEASPIIEKEIPSLVAAVAEAAPEAPLASPVPPAPAIDMPVEVKGDELVMRLGDRRYRVRGLQKNLSYDVLKVNVLVGRGEFFHVDTFDLYQAKHRGAFVKQAATELGLEEGVVHKDLGRVLLKLEELQDQEIQKTLEPEEKAPAMSDAERKAALALLKDPNLLDRILRDFAACGVVGEETNKLLGYLAAVSRKLEEPLAVVIQSSSAAGKSSLMEAILAFMPDEDRVKYSAMTGQSLFYMGETRLKHKILAIVEEHGAERASYALKLLQSEGELMIASTGKDGTTGRLVTHEYKVQGPVMIFLTTTAIEIDEELLNRCIVLTVDENREQTRAIHRRQRERETLTGLLARRDREALLQVHRNAQRLLRPLVVANPFAERLTFLDDRTRTRRDHMKYLVLIRAVALLFQYQRPQKTARHRDQDVSFIEATLDDIGIANKLAHEVLGRSLDELPPQTRRLLLEIDRMVNEACRQLHMDRQDLRFTRRDVRERTGWGNTQLKHHLRRLEELEYLLAHRSRHGQRFEYELVYSGEGKDGAPFLPGLLDVEKLGQNRMYDGNRSGFSDDRSGPGRPEVGPMSGGGRGGSSATNRLPEANSRPPSPESPENAYIGAPEAISSYVPSRRNGSSLPLSSLVAASASSSNSGRAAS